jgi:hypothetical protein
MDVSEAAFASTSLEEGVFFANVRYPAKFTFYFVSLLFRFVGDHLFGI